MKINRRFVVYGSLGVVVAFLGAGIVWEKSRSYGPLPSKTGIGTPSTKLHGITGEGAIITEVVVVNISAPDYKRNLTFSSQQDEAVRDLLTRQFNEVQGILANDETDFGAWVHLGTLRKTTGDYEGAAEVWQYAAKIYPDSIVPHDNLGNLYTDFLPDYPKAEASFKASIAISPHNIHAYQQLFALYTVYGYRSGTSAAANLLAEGLRNNPKNQTLLDLQEQLGA